MNFSDFKRAVLWIAENDNSGEDTPTKPDAEENVAGYISTLLVADLFRKEPSFVAQSVMRVRRLQAEIEARGAPAPAERPERSSGGKNIKLAAGEPNPDLFDSESTAPGELNNGHVFHLFQIVGGYIEHAAVCGVGALHWQHYPSAQFARTFCAKCVKLARAAEAASKQARSS